MPSPDGGKRNSAVSLRRSRAALRERLEARRAEMEEAALTRLYVVSDPGEVSNPDYLEGLRTALRAALDYGLEVIERGEERAPAIPPALLAQARMAARSGVSLEIVLRRYIAGYCLLTDFVIEEAGDAELLRDRTLHRILRGQAAVFERLISAIGEEYRRESRSRAASAEERRAERVTRLLTGELLDTSDLGYDFDAHHLGLVAAGPVAAEVIRNLADTLDARLLLVRCGTTIVWAWLGGRRRIESTAVWQLDGDIKQRGLRGSADGLHAKVTLAVGESGKGLTGWRLTHRQAAAALPVAQRRGDACIRYADVAVLAAALQDELLATSLRELYLKPLSRDRDGGRALRRTLRAYFDADHNASSAAAALGVSRRTVANRLRTVDDRLGCPLRFVAGQLEAALLLQELEAPRPHAPCP